MSAKQLTAVIVGAGWAGEGHTKALEHYGVKVVAICARKPDVVQKVALKLGIPEASIDWRETISRIKPDIVAIGTPGILRTEPIELAAELGCHIYCDKPLALTAEEAGCLYKVVDDAGVKHAYAATHLYDPSVAWVNQLLTEQKVIGELREIDVTYDRWSGHSSSEPPKRVKPWNWMNSLRHGGGALHNGLPHQLGMLEWMTGMKMVSAIGEARVYPRKAPVVPAIRDFRVWRAGDISAEEAKDLEWRECDVESTYSALLKFAHPSSKAEHPVIVTMRPSPGVPTPKPGRRWYFHGDKGTLVGQGGHILHTITRHADGETEEYPIPQALVDDLPDLGEDIQNKWVALARDFIADIEGRPHQSYLTFFDGWRYQIAIDAIRHSNGWAEIPNLS